MQSFLIFFLLSVASVWADSTGLVFFRLFRLEFVPLTIMRDQGYSFFSTSPSQERIPEFSLHNGVLSTQDEPNAGDAGFYDSTLAYGPKVNAVTFELDGYGTIIKPKLFSCRKSTNDPAERFTLSKIEGELCNPTEIFLLTCSAAKHSPLIGGVTRV